MANRWIGVALVGCCLAATPVRAQGPVSSEPTGCGTCGSGAMMPGPLNPAQAPPGPSDDLSLPGNVPNAFGCEPPGPPCCPRVYTDFSYLAWWFKNQNMPPLVTTTTGTPVAGSSGSLADPNVAPLITQNTLQYRNPFSGGRVTLGYFLDDKQATAFEASAFIVGQGTVSSTVLSNTSGVPVIASPYTNFQTGAQAAYQYALPGTSVGGVTASASGRLWGGEANFVCNYPDCCFCCIPLPISLLVGARYLNLDERINMTGFTEGIAAGTNPIPTTSLDSFHTRNQYVGGQIGARLGWSFGPWFVGGQAKMGIGEVEEQVQVNGNTTLVAPGLLPVSEVGHLYALSSNIGNYIQHSFAYVPEGEARFGYRFNANLLAYVGYSFLYISKVARPGDQIDTVLDVRQSPVISPIAVPTYTRPAVIPISESPFWAQGVNVGIEITF